MNILGFYINLPIGGFVAVLLFMVTIPDQVTKPQGSKLRTALSEMDLIGFAIFAPASVMFFLALQFGGNQFAWNSATIIGLFCGASVTFIIFFLWEWKQGNEAMIPLPMLWIRTVWAAGISNFFFMGLVYIASFYLPIYFQAVKGASPTSSGVDLLPSILSQVLFAVLSGILGELNQCV